jgi:hypothetical protein
MANNNLAIEKSDSHHQCKRQTYLYTNLDFEESFTMIKKKIPKVAWHAKNDLPLSNTECTQANQTEDLFESSLQICLRIAALFQVLNPFNPKPTLL